jgi:Mg2+/Co2+ transporter CorB
MVFIGLSLLLTAFASAAEAAVTLANPFRVRRMAAEGVTGARLADGILEREEWHVYALIIVKNAALIVAASLTTVGHCVGRILSDVARTLPL